MTKKGQRTAACGLSCLACDQYRLPDDQAVQARMIPFYRSQGWLKDEEGLETAIAKKMYCKGCGHSEVWWSDNCWIYQCCRINRQLNTCAECPELPCERLSERAQMNDRYKESLDYLLAQRARSTDS